MNFVEIKGWTHEYGNPPESKVECGTLYTRLVDVNGQLFHVSEWKPTVEELQQLLANGSVFLWCSAAPHPIVAMGTEYPEVPCAVTETKIQ